MVCTDFTVLQLSMISATGISVRDSDLVDKTECHTGEHVQIWIAFRNDSPTAGIADCVLTVTGPTPGSSSQTPFSVMVPGDRISDCGPCYWTPAAAGSYTICVEVTGQRPA